jgi:hypothetical protein
MMAGEWWSPINVWVDPNVANNNASTINGKLGDSYNCSGNHISNSIHAQIDTNMFR